MQRTTMIWIIYIHHVQQVTKSLIDYQIYFQSYFWFKIILSTLISYGMNE